MNLPSIKRGRRDLIKPDRAKNLRYFRYLRSPGPAAEFTAVLTALSTPKSGSFSPYHIALVVIGLSRPVSVIGTSAGLSSE